ncbi:serine protease [Allocoleopsis sp.]|uniref:S1 family peptidase n=1 Tax=Allocoleopsis sp. TaxID=3088169 RepID=UPI002FD2752A
MLLKKPSRRWLSVLASTTIVLLNLNSTCLALPREQIEEIARQSTARIYGREGTVIGVETAGSVVLIARDGNTYYGLTNAHVVRETGDYFTLVTLDAQEHRVDPKQTKLLPNVDLAVVRFISDRNYPLIQLGDSDSLQIGQTIYLTGWLGGIMRYFNEGKLVEYTSQLTQEGLGLAYSNVSDKGMSGGSLLDEEGRLIGIHSARGRVTRNSEPKSSIAVGLGVPINTLIQLAPQAGLDPALITILNSASRPTH